MKSVGPVLGSQGILSVPIGVQVPSGSLFGIRGDSSGHHHIILESWFEGSQPALLGLKESLGVSVRIPQGFLRDPKRGPYCSLFGNDGDP